MHTNITNNKRKARASGLMNKKNIRVPVSTVTHTTEEVAKHFLEWRKAQANKSLIGHNNPPN
jgi:hypothetical protein